MWDALKDGSISMVVSDHSPCTPDLKLPDRGDFMAAWGGIAGLQLGESSMPNLLHTDSVNAFTIDRAMLL